MKIFDSHTHLNDLQLYPQADQYFQHAQNLGVVKIANVGSNQKLNDLSLELAAQYDDMYSIIGWHPEDSIHYHEAEEKLLIEQLQSPKVVAVGEIGLDYHQTTSPREVQKRVFKRQIDIAKQLHLPISIHNRDAFEDTYAILKEMDVSDIRGVMHSFNGDVEWLKKFLDLGCWFLIAVLPASRRPTRFMTPSETLRLMRCWSKRMHRIWHRSPCAVNKMNRRTRCTRLKRLPEFVMLIRMSLLITPITMH